MRFRALALLPLLVCCASTEAQFLRLATWNLEQLAQVPGSGCRPRSDADYRRLQDYANRLNADLIALQEIESRTAAERVFNPDTYAIELSRRPQGRLGRCGGRSSQERTMLRTGFAINTERLAELGLTYRRLPDLSAIGGESLRWATRILIEPVAGSGKPIELLSLHLKSGCAYGRLAGKIHREQCRVLRGQLGILEEWLDAQARAAKSYILLGDFNRQLDQPNDHMWAAMDDGEVCTWVPDTLLGRRCLADTVRKDRNADLVLANAGRPFPFPKNPRYPYAIDHIILDAKTARHLIPDSYAVLGFQGAGRAPSDHHPISVSLRMWHQ